MLEFSDLHAIALLGNAFRNSTWDGRGKQDCTGREVALYNEII